MRKHPGIMPFVCVAIAIITTAHAGVARGQGLPQLDKMPTRKAGPPVDFGTSQETFVSIGEWEFAPVASEQTYSDLGLWRIESPALQHVRRRRIPGARPCARRSRAHQHCLRLLRCEHDGSTLGRRARRGIEERWRILPRQQPDVFGLQHRESLRDLHAGHQRVQSGRRQPDIEVRPLRDPAGGRRHERAGGRGPRVQAAVSRRRREPRRSTTCRRAIRSSSTSRRWRSPASRAAAAAGTSARTRR